MIFSQSMCATAQAGWEAQLERAGEPRASQLRGQMDLAERKLPEDAVLAAKWICANSPLSDLANYDLSLFLSCGEHGAFLRESSPLARDVPEDIFLNYVLHTRVNEEELCSCRKFFHSQLSERVAGLDAAGAAVEANYWCAENVTYQSTDLRTSSALGVYRGGCGRCGEESAFAVNVFRSLGIPARQIYTPRWAHCDDNHAWVEVWCGGQWYFLGACEPEEVLNRGWFTNAASRAMLIHSRCFGPITGEEVISRVGMVTFLNHLRRYAVTTTLTAAVRDQAGMPVEGARVSFGILNGCDVFPAAVMTTDAAGTARLTCGLGSISVGVRQGDLFCERIVHTGETDRVELVLARETPAREVWVDFVFSAPRDQIVTAACPTREQRELGMKRTAAANELRRRRLDAMFDRARAEAVVEKHGYGPDILALLRDSRGNLERLLAFLEDGAFSPREKEAALLTLSAKDRRDVDPEVVREALASSRGYAGAGEALFYPYIVFPRVFNEPLEKNRQFILDWFSQEQKETFRRDPASIWAYIRREIAFDPALEYGQIVTGPVGALTVKNASPLSQRILFVSICRALGVAARLNPADQTAEYWAEGRFAAVERAWRGECTLLLEGEAGESWQYGADFALGILEDGAYRTLDLSGERWTGSRLEITVSAGEYRIITDNRLPNGDLYASKYHLRLAAGETKLVRLRRHQADLKDMLGSYALEEFCVRDRQGREVPGSALTERGAVLLWLEEGREPTEHILNEMLELAADLRSLPADIVLLVRSREALENAKVQRVLEAIPGIKVYFDSFVPNVETLARRMYVDPEKLPLILVAAHRLHAVYASSGYNVGSGEMVVKVCRSVLGSAPVE